MSFRTSCSCSAIVPVESTTFFPLRIAGTRYASDFPTPVPASTIVCMPSRMPRSTICAICTCPERGSKPGSALRNGPRGANVCSIVSGNVTVIRAAIRTRSRARAPVRASTTTGCTRRGGA